MKTNYYDWDFARGLAMALVFVVLAFSGIAWVLSALHDERRGFLRDCATHQPITECEAAAKRIFPEDER